MSDEEYKKEESKHDGFQVGDRVEGNYNDEGTYFPGMIARIHGNGNTYTIDYEDGDKEKRVPENRIRERSGKKAAKSGKFSGKVQVLEDGDWLDASIVKVHSNGITYTVEYSDSGEKETKVPEDRIRNVKVIAVVYKLKELVQVSLDGNWYDAVITMVRKTGYDVEYEKDKEIEKRIKANRIRKRLKVLAKNDKVSYVDGEQVKHAGTVVRVRSNGTYDIQHTSDDEHVSKKVDRHDIEAVTITKLASIMSGITGRLAAKKVLQVDQKVKFKGKDGAFHIGTITRFKGDEDAMADIEHESDDDVTSKNIARKDIQPAKAESNFAGAASAISNRLKISKNSTFKLSTKVEYDDSDDEPHAGTICNVRNNDTFDVQHDSDDNTIVKRITRDRLRAKTENASFFNRKRSTGDASLKYKMEDRVTFKLKSKWKDGVICKILGDDLYNVEYVEGDDDRVAKRIKAADIQRRKRSSLKRKRNLENDQTLLGNEVNVVLESPTEGVRRQKAVIEWVHHDENLVVRTLDDDKVHSTLSPESVADLKNQDSGAVNVFGLQQLGQAELWWFIANILFELIVYGWFSFGIMVEISEGFHLFLETSPEYFEESRYMTSLYAQNNRSSCILNKSEAIDVIPARFGDMDIHYTLIRSHVIRMDRIWLLVLLSAMCLLFIGFMVHAMQVFRSKWNSLQHRYIQFAHRRKEMKYQHRMSVLLLCTVVLSSGVLLCYSSLLNKLDYYCIWNAEERIFAIDELAFKSNPFDTRSQQTDISLKLLEMTSRICFNLFRNIALFLAIETGHSISTRILALPPAVLATVVIGLKTIGSFHIMHYVQRIFVQKGEFSLNIDLDLAVLLVVFAQWLNGVVLGVFFAVRNYGLIQHRNTIQGELSEDQLEAAERGELGAQAKLESLVERRNQARVQAGRVNLALLSLNKCSIIHIAVLVISLIASLTLRSTVSEFNDEWLKYTTIDLVMTCVWLCVMILVPCMTCYVRSTYPNLNDLNL